MLDDLQIRSQAMPDAMRVLLDDYPRESWETHPGFHDKTRYWLGAHQMFRRLGKLVRTETENYLDGGRAPDDYAGRLSHYGSALVGNLHGHHRWEDYEYFPELSKADPRRGRFRAFVKVALSNFFRDRARMRSAQKRGGRQSFVPWTSETGETFDLPDVRGRLPEEGGSFDGTGASAAEGEIRSVVPVPSFTSWRMRRARVSPRTYSIAM